MATETYADLETITAAWLDQYPGNAPALVLLRDQFIRANHRFVRAEAAFDEALLVAPSLILRQLAQLERSYQRHYKNLQNYRPPNPPPSEKAEAEKPKNTGPQRIIQDIHIRTHPDGTVTTEIEWPNSTWVPYFKGRGPELRKVYLLVRQVHFDEGIPEPYRSWPFLATRDFNKPNQFIKLEYGVDEFLRLDEYEREFNPEFLILEPPADYGRQDIFHYPQQPAA